MARLMPKEFDIEKLKKEIERLNKLVYYDELTGLLNRRGFLEEVTKAFRAISFRRTEIERRIGFQIPFTLIFFDLDDFKKINDIHGHEAGDIVLKNIAAILQSRLRLSDVSCRWGGEEFLVALLGADVSTAFKIAENLKEIIEAKKIPVKKEKLKITASFGVAGYTNEPALEELIKKADEAMYKSKKGGKNRVTIFK
jgi:diguanylate cyclase (GGDEF)-like protein